MNYQKLICWGDSQTFGARTYGCYPLYLIKKLNKRSRYTWTVINHSQNGDTARDLWFKLHHQIIQITDVNCACILIGTNDVGNHTPIHLFRDYYQQMVDSLEIYGVKVIHCGEIPPIWPDAHPFFDKDSNKRRKSYNKQISKIVTSSPIARFVRFPGLKRKHYVDPVHFNEKGNKTIAKQFAKSILNGQKL